MAARETTNAHSVSAGESDITLGRLTAGWEDNIKVHKDLAHYVPLHVLIRSRRAVFLGSSLSGTSGNGAVSNSFWSVCIRPTLTSPAAVSQASSWPSVLVLNGCVHVWPAWNDQPRHRHYRLACEKNLPVPCATECRKVDSHLSVTCQFRISAVRAVTDTQTSSHVLQTAPFTHNQRTERTVLTRNWHVTHKRNPTSELSEITPE
jgi:hypothetical protein